MAGMLTARLDGVNVASMALGKLEKRLGNLREVFREIKAYQEEGHQGGGASWSHSARWQGLHHHKITVSPQTMTTKTTVDFKLERPLRLITVKGEKHHREVFERWVERQVDK